jgi:hypothetical protein
MIRIPTSLYLSKPLQENIATSKKQIQNYITCSWCWNKAEQLQRKLTIVKAFKAKDKNSISSTKATTGHMFSISDLAEIAFPIFTINNIVSIVSPKAKL